MTPKDILMYIDNCLEFECLSTEEEETVIRMINQIPISLGNKWVSVDKAKELLKINEKVICYTNKHRTVFSWLDGGTNEFDDNDISEDEFYTHFKPLPSPPKQ